MNRLRMFLELLWQLLPEAGLATEYHPSTKGGAIPIPFIQSQKLLLETELFKPDKNIPKLTNPIRSFTGYMQGYSSLPLRDRALVALRSAHLCNARHLIPDISLCAEDAGLTYSDLQMVAKGFRAPGWSRHDKLLLRLTEDLYTKQSLPSVIWKELIKIYSPQQLLDLIFCIASFHLCVYPN